MPRLTGIEAVVQSIAPHLPMSHAALRSIAL
jgi:hypothetical protein